MKKQRLTGFLRGKQYVIAGAVVAIAVVGTTVLYSNSQEQEREQMEAQLAEEMNESQDELAAVEEDTEQTQTASTVISPLQEGADVAELADAPTEEELLAEEAAQLADEAAQVAGATENEAEEVSTVEDTLHFSPDDGMTWPLEGDVILNYSMDATVYFPTLEQYKYNPAVIISGEVNDKVYSVAKGQVVDISNNEVTGCTMTVDLGDGYQAIYGQLKELNFAVGDYVEAGHVLGFVAEPTKYFSVEGSNLYFALEKDGVPVDPVEFFE